MSTLTISHADWELLEDVPPGSATFNLISATLFTISVPVGDKTALFTITGNFTNPQGMSVATWLATVSGVVSSISLSIDGVLQLNATGLALDVSEVIDDAVTKIHDVVELAIGDQALIFGSDDADHLAGHGGDDSISGGKGNDDLFGDLGDDSLSGGSGSDTVSGGDGNDSLYGGIGDDSLYGGIGDDRLSGDSGNDYLSGGSGNDSYRVDSDADRISESALSSGGYDVEYASVSESALASGVEKLVLTGSALNGVGNAGNNVLLGNTAANRLSAGAGDDSVAGGAGDDSCFGGLGSDSLYGSTGNDRLYGEAGDDSMAGGSGNDIYYVDSDLDRISESTLSSEGYDTEYASVSESALAAGVERLVLTGTAIKGVGNGANNVLQGNAAANSLSGGGGNDNVVGGAGNDTCSGGLGDDRLTGGQGVDHLSGDAGHDTYDFNSLSELGLGSGSRDLISGFTRGEDKIDLSTIDANGLLANDQAFTFVDSFSATAGEVRYSGGIVYLNTDADTAAEYEIQLIGTVPAVMAATDFVL